VGAIAILLMELSSEDLLRLNVLLANKVEAIRIDDQALSVHGLAGDQEAGLNLNPNCRPDQYLRRVRELLSSHVLGSPGGYPVFLQRWTRMGQAKHASLDKLLLLGEPEAVVAVAGAPDLTDELARRVWWIQPTADIARRMLQRTAVVEGAMGRKLAAYLVEHLPFETDPLTVITTVRLVLQPGLIDAATRLRIWGRGDHRNAYHIGFLEAIPDELPEPVPARADHSAHAARLSALAEAGNDTARALERALASPGQTFVAACERLLEHPVNNDAAAALLNAIGNYFRPFAPELAPSRDIARIIERAGAIDSASPVGAVANAFPELRPTLAAARVLAQADEQLIIEILAKTSASGTLLRRKLDGVVTPLLQQCAVLRGSPTQPSTSRRQRRI